MSTLSTLEIKAIGDAIAAAKTLINDIEPVLRQLDLLYNGTGDLTNSISQGDLDSATQYSGLTKQQLDDAFFALTSGIAGAIGTAYASLEILAARG